MLLAHSGSLLVTLDRRASSCWIVFLMNKSAGLHGYMHDPAVLAAMIKPIVWGAASRVGCARLTPAVDPSMLTSLADGDPRHWLSGAEREESRAISATSPASRCASHRRGWNRPETASCAGLPVASKGDARTDLTSTSGLRLRLKVLVAVLPAAARVPGHLFVRSPPQLVVAVGR